MIPSYFIEYIHYAPVLGQHKTAFAPIWHDVDQEATYWPIKVQTHTPGGFYYICAAHLMLLVLGQSLHSVDTYDEDTYMNSYTDW